MAPEAVPINASVASTGTDVQYIGDRIYLNTGSVSTVTVGEVTLAETTFGSGYSVISILYFIETNAGDDMKFKTYMNRQLVFMSVQNISPQQSRVQYYPLTLVVPPFTILKCTSTNASEGTAMSVGVSISGRVYGVAG